MSNSAFSNKDLRNKSSSKGFVFILELVIAFIIFAGLIQIAPLGSEMLSPSFVQTSQKENLALAIHSLDTNSSFVDVFDSELTDDEKMNLIYSKLLEKLPNELEARIEARSFLESNDCNVHKDFNNCFGSALTLPAKGNEIDSNKSVVHQRVFLVKKSPPENCSISAVFSPTTPLEALSNSKIKNLFFSEKKKKLSFASSPDLNINFNVTVTPSTQASCGEDINADLNAVIPALGRNPANIMLVNDRSGSMSWDGLLDLTNPRDIFISGNYAFVADGSAGLRDINIIAPRTLSVLGTLNTAGTAGGVSVLGNYAFIADGTNGLVVANITNKSSPTLSATLTGIGTAIEVAALGNYAYVTTTSNGTTDFSDFNISGSQNVDLNIGQLTQDFNVGATSLDNNNYIIGLTGANYAISQSFVAASSSIRAVSVYIRKSTSQNPPANLTVQLRTALPGSGSTLATGTITAASLSTNKAWIDTDFGSDIAVTLGQTYYLVLSTTGTNASRYYQWYSRTSTPSIYSNGISYVVSAAQNSTDAFLQTKISISQAAQSFIPSSNSIRIISLYLRQNPTGADPAGNLTVSLRQTIGGPSLASATIIPSTTTNSYAWIDADFGSDISVDPSATYYVVASTTGASSVNYYQWAALNTNPYSSGNAYIQTTAQPNYDSFIRTNHRARTGLQIIDISNPLIPVHKSSSAGTDPNNSFVLGNYAYFSDGTAGLRIIDVSNPINANQVGIIDTTDAQGLFVSGNYAYVADGSSGLRIIDIATKESPTIVGTYNTPGTAYDSFYYSDGNVYTADNNSLLAIDVSTPASPVLKRTFAAFSSSTYRKVWVDKDWAFLAPGYSTGIVAFSILQGPKIDQSKTSANYFIDNNGWRTTDLMGVISFSSSATTDRNLMYLTDTNKNLLKSTIASLIADGGTDMGAGIRAATAELSSARVSPNAFKFQILLSDGEADSPLDANLAARDANALGIKIYTIGFGSGAGESTLRSIASITDANYYRADDANALKEVYDLIAIDIGEILAQGQTKAYDANIMIPISNCEFVTDSGRGTCQKINDSNYLIYTIGYIDPHNIWRDYFTTNIPCSSQVSCATTQLTIPSSGTTFFWEDSNGAEKTPIQWDINKTLIFKYRDLAINIVNASINAFNTVTLDINAENVGLLDSIASKINFYISDTFLDSNHTSDIFALPSYSEKTVTPLTAGNYKLIEDNEFEQSGWIYAVINKDYTIAECPGNNIAYVYCSSIGETEYIVLDFYAWRK